MDRTYSIRRPWAAFAAGAAIGTLGGLIGLGGAEFRLPVLITVFALYAHRAVRFNLLVSLVTLTFAAATRVNLTTATALSAYTDVVASMVIGGVIAAWIGARLLSRVPPSRLMSIISALLLIVALMLLAEAVYTGGAIVTLPQDSLIRFSVGLFAGLLVGAVSSLLGVAGGEFIIPILIFIFDADIKTAGTLSLIISLPVVAVGVAKHRLTGNYRSHDVLKHLVLPMSAGSIFGAVAGGYLSASAPTDALKIVLAVILATSAVKLAQKESFARKKP